ncbi:TPM domain-containing protein [Acinetobacter rathckeae]|uniref:TPM domain-containing protein n=1 Tax=Acinetobacter rathckeae TaxID=2605272 RepID=UPI0018A2AD23|nr:TPM domain-containing protein [Acinetobacter rathckeae]
MHIWCSNKLGLFFKVLISVLLLSSSVLAWSDDQNKQLLTTTALSDQSPDDAIVGQVVQEQQAKKNNNKPSQQSTNTPQSVANDLQDGQSTRTLPTLNQPVIDQTHLLNTTQLKQLSDQITQIHRTAKAQIGVVIVPSTGQEDIFDFAIRLANQWKLGTQKQDNGIVIAVAVNDRRIQILTGYGLEGVLPDVVVSRIIRNQITPAFKEGNIALGLMSGINEIQRIINLDPAIAQQAAQQLKQQHEIAIREQESRDQMLLYTAIILIVGIFASSFFGHRLTASVAGVTAVSAGLLSGAGLLVSLLLGAGVFFLLITSLAQLLLQIFTSGGGSGGDSSGGNDSSGYSGGGGDFGGGGASGSW